MLLWFYSIPQTRSLPTLTDRFC
uniref:Uncharacterized protein n=1 Tax=Rhizophora mucronata TaxID=61149 RepID=A0A2P2Q9Y7_RHIMU